MKPLFWGSAILMLSAASFAAEETANQPLSPSNLTPQTNTWVELGLGTASTLNIKRTTDGIGWGISFARYDDIEFFGDGKMDAQGKSIDDGVQEVAVLRVQSKSWRWGYSDFSYGLAYQHTILANSCTKLGEGWFGASYSCVKEEKQGLSIPLEVNLAFGRYAGIGVKLRGSIGSENVAGVALSIPLGGFAKK